MSRSDALRFIDVLRQGKVNVLGAEVWRWVGDRYKMDSLLTWYAIEQDFETNLKEVGKFVEEMDLAERDLMTLQFSEANDVRGGS